MADPILDMAVKLYGPGMASLLNHPDTDVVKAVRDAATGEWDRTRLEGALAQTAWWQQTQASARTWDQRKASDPATVESEVIARIYEMHPLVSRLGVNIPLEQSRKIAEDSLRFGWDMDRIETILGGMVTADNVAEVGGINASISDIRATAAQWFVGVDEDQARQWATRIATGDMKLDDLVGTFRNQAKARFRNDPEMAKLFDQGVTPSDAFANVRNTIAQTLEIPPDKVDMVGSTRWSQVLDFVDEKGVQRPMTQTEATKWARHQSEFRETGTFQREDAATASYLAEQFGFRGSVQ